MANEYATYKGATYANGKIPKSLLKPLDGNNLALPGDPAVLREDAAAAWNRARADVFAKTGLTLTVRGWMRSIGDQEKFFFRRYKKGAYSPFNDYRSYKGATYGRTNGAAAAIPGTSNHGLGTTVDVVDFGSVGQFNNPRRVKAIGILRAHGWDDTEGRGKIQEPWHLNYIPSQDKHKGATPPPIKKEEGFLMGLSDEKQQAVYVRTNQIKEQQNRIEELLKERVPDIGTSLGLKPAAALGRILVVVRRIEARIIAKQIVPVSVDVNTKELAEALVKVLPAATAKAVLDQASARLKA